METCQERITYLDNLRILLVYAVVLLHIICMYAYPLSFWWPTIDKSGSSLAFENLLVTLDAFLMPHLIFISAFFIFYSLKNKSPLAYLKKRFTRLFVPIIVFTLCAGDIHYQILFNRLGMSDPAYLSTFLDYWRGFLDFGAITVVGGGKMLHEMSFNMQHTWFLSFLFLLTVVVVFIATVFRKKEKVPAKTGGPKKIVAKTIVLSLVLGILFLAAAILFTILSSGKGVRFDSFIRVLALVQVRIDQIFMLICLFLFGLYMYRKEWLTLGDIGNWKMWGALSAGVVFVYILLFNNTFFPVLNEIYKIAEHNLTSSNQRPFPEMTDPVKLVGLTIWLLEVLLCMFLLMFFLSFSRAHLNRPNKITAFCSKHSINVYLLHYIPVLILQDYFVDIPVAPIIKTILMLVIVIPACLWLSYRLVYPYPAVAICLFALLKTISLFLGFNFYYSALLALLAVSLAGGLYDAARFLVLKKAVLQNA